MNSSVESLQEECVILGKLLRRNFNQHGTTRLFGYLRRAYKTCDAYLQDSKINSVIEKGLYILRKTSSNSSSNNGGSDYKRILKLHQNIIRSCSEVILCVVRAYSLLKQQLHRKVYVPLFTVLLAISSKMATTTSSLYSTIHEQYQNLCSRALHRHPNSSSMQKCVDDFRASYTAGNITNEIVYNLLQKSMTKPSAHCLEKASISTSLDTDLVEMIPADVEMTEKDLEKEKEEMKKKISLMEV